MIIEVTEFEYKLILEHRARVEALTKLILFAQDQWREEDAMHRHANSKL